MDLLTAFGFILAVNFAAWFNLTPEKDRTRMALVKAGACSPYDLWGAAYLATWNHLVRHSVQFVGVYDAWNSWSVASPRRKILKQRIFSKQNVPKGQQFCSFACSRNSEVSHGMAAEKFFMGSQLRIFSWAITQKFRIGFHGLVKVPIWTWWRI